MSDPKWPGDHAPELQRALYWLEVQEVWMAQAGGNLLGYLLHYGSINDPDHSGDGGEAIYAADEVALVKARDRYLAALARAERKGKCKRA